MSVWPDVLKNISERGIKNYTIYLREPEDLLFGTIEYSGDDFDADMKKIANDPGTQHWWKLTDACQSRLESATDGEQCSLMEEVFHHE